MVEELNIYVRGDTEKYGLTKTDDTVKVSELTIKGLYAGSVIAIPFPQVRLAESRLVGDLDQEQVKDMVIEHPVQKFMGAFSGDGKLVGVVKVEGNGAR